MAVLSNRMTADLGGGATGPRIYSLADLLNGQLGGANVTSKAIRGGTSYGWAPDANVGNFMLNLDAAKSLFGSSVSDPNRRAGGSPLNFDRDNFRFTWDPTQNAYSAARIPQEMAPGGLLAGLETQHGDLMPTTTGNLGIVNKPGQVGATPMPSTPQPPPNQGLSAQQLLAAQQAKTPRPSMVSWRDVAPSTIDLNALGALFNPDANVMGGFQKQRDTTNQQVESGRGEVNRQRAFGEQQVGTLPAEYERIFGGLNNMVSGLGSTADAELAARAAGVPGLAERAGTAAANPTLAAQNLVRGGFDATVPLLKAGFGEQAARQNGFLTQLASQMMGDIDARQNDYLGGLNSARSNALAQAQGQNASLLNNAAQFNASNRAEVDRFNSEAQAAWDRGEFDNALKLSQLAQQKVNGGMSPVELALHGVAPGMSLEEIAAANQPTAAKKDMDLQALVAKIPTGSSEVSLPKALQLQAQNFQPFGGGTDAYEQVLAKLKSGADPAEAMAWAQKKYPNYSRAVNLALLNGGAFKDQLGGIFFGG